MTPYLLVDGVRIVPDKIDKPRLRFRLRLPADEIRLISGAARPAELEDSSDTRRLGVLLRGMHWEFDGEAIEVPLDQLAFVDGFHAVEIHNPAFGPVRWTTGDAALPPSSFPPWQGEVLLHLSVGEWRGSSALGASVTAAAALLSAFESLGEDCEFGLAQRHYLVEPPLSLFRWGGAEAVKLIEGLDSDFSGLDQQDTADLVWSGNEYFLRTPYVTLHTNCTVEQDAAGLQELLNFGRATSRILRRKLLKDIAEARRIFVFKAIGPKFGGTEMVRLHQALSRIGPASLLCVKAGVADQPGGGAYRMADRLYVGYLDRFVIPDGPFDQWLSVCAATMDLHRPG